MSQPTVVIFLDCLGYEEAINCDYIGSTLKGKIISGVPRVTPYVVSGILTGRTPPNHGLLSPVRLGRQPVTKPMTKTLIEEMGERYKTLNFEMPFTMGLEEKNLVNIGSAVGNVQQQRPPALFIPKPTGDFIKDDPEKVLDDHIDNIKATFGTVRNMIRAKNFDIVFLSIRSVDSFGHFLFKEQRKRLIEYLDLEVKETEWMGDINLLVFSDHGITDKQHTFYLNKWLIENGYLSVDIFRQGLKDQMKKDANAMEMLSLFSDLVHINEESYFASTDVFDSGIKALRKDAPIERLREELMDTGFYNGIYTPAELWGHGKYDDELDIDLVCDRADGVLVAGNIYPHLTDTVDANNYCQGNVRTGVHDRFGVWGVNHSFDGMPTGDFKPENFYYVMRDFLGLTRTETETEIADSGQESKELADRLKELGYG